MDNSRYPILTGMVMHSYSVHTKYSGIFCWFHLSWRAYQISEISLIISDISVWWDPGSCRKKVASILLVVDIISSSYWKLFLTFFIKSLMKNFRALPFVTLCKHALGKLNKYARQWCDWFFVELIFKNFWQRFAPTGTNDNLQSNVSSV